MKQHSNKQKKAHSPKEACPHCSLLFTPGTGLASHIRLMHGKGVQAHPVAGKPVIKTLASKPAVDSHAHVKAALDQLMARKNQIDQELGRADALQSESREVGQRIEALNIALRAFGQKSMSASATS